MQRYEPQDDHQARESIKKVNDWKLIQYRAGIYMFMDRLSYPAGHVQVSDEPEASLWGQKLNAEIHKEQLINSTILVPLKAQSVLNFEVSGDFDIGILPPAWEKKKGKKKGGGKGKKGKRPRHRGVEDLVGMKVPSFLALDPKLETEMHFFDPNRLFDTVGVKLKILINRVEGSISFTYCGQKSAQKLYNKTLLTDVDHWWEPSHRVSVAVIMRTDAFAKVTFKGYSIPEKDIRNFLFVAKFCPKAYGNLPYGLLREIAEFI